MNKSYIIAFLILIFSVLWIASGYIGGEPTYGSGEAIVSGDGEGQESKNVMKVQTVLFAPKEYNKSINANGRSEPSKDIVIRAEAEGQIMDVIIAEGEAVSKDGEIFRIDIREKKERVKEAEEAVKQRQIEYDAAKRLSKDGFASDVRLAQTQSELEAARATLTRAKIDLDKTIVKAPFDGVLGDRHVDVGDYVTLGDPLNDFVDLNPLEVSVFLNEKEVIQLAKGNEATLSFMNGEIRNGLVTYIAPSADTDTRTFRVKIEIDNTNHSLPAGLTAQASIKVKTKQAYEIPASILTLNDAGVVGVKAVSKDNKISFVPITIIDDSPDTMWVSGLSGEVQIVTVGQDFLADGQTVDPVLKDLEGQ